ncbi:MULTISPECIES: hypothetical protein [unclassified Herbaspirillum]|uniref:hypothetical protein n=1 Tax=unclassified Herbaspirillum TaxID=2624150 RepID=UPI0010720492|nr:MULTISPECIES: hypothetical protein [unclassified Herbaspirillum]TFI10429.1 hypothetical protein E4P32_02505 [Herbaspirillum sp. 3R11]TFI16334.1 hypothetical protein E4P31_02510 [Herbaspirillum sp. 3R-11]TFI21487.1 hypothetical protein E4P30_20590 [Herbaspirillum sp. 3C11]
MPNREFFICGSMTRNAIVAVAIALASPPTLAAPNDNCQMQISNTVIDYGQVTRAELLERQVSPTAFALGKQTMTLSVNCRQPTLMTIYFRGAAGDGNGYRFGNAGNFVLNLSLAQLDGKRVKLGNVKVTGQQPDNMAEIALLTPGVGIVPVQDERTLKGASFSVQVEINTSVSGTASRVADRTTWRSSGSFELVEN